MAILNTSKRSHASLHPGKGGTWKQPLASNMATGLQQLQLLDWGILTAEYYKTKDIVKNYHSCCKTQAKNNSPTVEFTNSLKEPLFDNIP